MDNLGITDPDGMVRAKTRKSGIEALEEFLYEPIPGKRALKLNQV